MAKDSNWIWWTIGGLSVVGLGVGAFIFFKDRKEKNSQPTTPDVTSGGTTYSPSTSTPAASALSPTPFKNKEEGNAFRKWVNEKYPEYAKSIDLDKTGRFDNNTIRTAWAKYGNEYKGIVNVVSPTPTTPQQGWSLEDLRNLLAKGNKTSDIEIDKKSKRIRGLALDGTGFGTNNIYVNLYPDGTLYFEDGTDGQKKSGTWTSVGGDLSIIVDGQKEAGWGGWAAYYMAKKLYPNVSEFAGNLDKKDAKEAIFRKHKKAYMDICDENL